METVVISTAVDVKTERLAVTYSSATFEPGPETVVN